MKPFIKYMAIVAILVIASVIMVLSAPNPPADTSPFPPQGTNPYYANLTRFINISIDVETGRLHENLDIAVKDLNATGDVRFNTPMAEVFAEGNVLATTIAVAGTFVEANFSQVNFTDMPYAFYTNGQNRTLTYNDTVPRMCHLGVTLSVSSAGANDVVQAKLYKNNNGLPGSLVEAKLQGIGDITSTAIHTMPSVISQGDNLTLYITNTIDTDAITVKHMNLFAVCMNSN